jgi:hypothetical protein
MGRSRSKMKKRKITGRKEGKVEKRTNAKRYVE